MKLLIPLIVDFYSAYTFSVFLGGLLNQVCFFLLARKKGLHRQMEPWTHTHTRTDSLDPLRSTQFDISTRTETAETRERPTKRIKLEPAAERLTKADLQKLEDPQFVFNLCQSQHLKIRLQFMLELASLSKQEVNIFRLFQKAHYSILFDLKLFDPRQKLQINNAAELITNGAGDTLYLPSTAATQFLQGREMFEAQSPWGFQQHPGLSYENHVPGNLALETLKIISFDMILQDYIFPSWKSKMKIVIRQPRFSFGSGEWRDGAVTW